MTTLTADEMLKAALCTNDEPAEVRDRQGNVLGYFIPGTRPMAELYAEGRTHSIRRR